jgi:hypothetical protein
MAGNATEPKLWFKARSFGWGWTPCSIEGWLVTIAGLAVLVGGDLAAVAWINVALDHAGIGFAAVIGWNALIVALLIWICWKTGERPSWRWRSPD